MYCTSCGNALQSQDNFCRQCGAKVGGVPAVAPPPPGFAVAPPPPPVAAVQKQETSAQKFLKRLGYAIVLQLQQQAIANALRQQQSGDNFWSSATACGNDNGQSGYVSVDGITVGYDR